MLNGKRGTVVGPDSREGRLKVQVKPTCSFLLPKNAAPRPGVKRKNAAPLPNHSFKQPMVAKQLFNRAADYEKDLQRFWGIQPYDHERRGKVLRYEWERQQIEQAEQLDKALNNERDARPAEVARLAREAQEETDRLAREAQAEAERVARLKPDFKAALQSRVGDGNDVIVWSTATDAAFDDPGVEFEEYTLLATADFDAYKADRDVRMPDLPYDVWMHILKFCGTVLEAVALARALPPSPTVLRMLRQLHDGALRENDDQIKFAMTAVRNPLFPLVYMANGDTKVAASLITQPYLWHIVCVKGVEFGDHYGDVLREGDMCNPLRWIKDNNHHRFDVVCDYTGGFGPDHTGGFPRKRGRCVSPRSQQYYIRVNKEKEGYDKILLKVKLAAPLERVRYYDEGRMGYRKSRKCRAHGDANPGHDGFTPTHAAEKVFVSRSLRSRVMVLKSAINKKGEHLSAQEKDRWRMFRRPDLVKMEKSFSCFSVDRAETCEFVLRLGKRSDFGWAWRSVDTRYNEDDGDQYAFHFGQIDDY